MNPPKIRIDPRSDIFQQQRSAMLARIEPSRTREICAAAAASKPTFDKHALLLRERRAQMLDPGGATKTTQVIQLCCQAQTPLVYLQNTTGCRVGAKSEAGGMIKHGSNMIQAVSNASMPQITIMCGAFFGGGNHGMCGRARSARTGFAFAQHRKIAVKGARLKSPRMQIGTDNGRGTCYSRMSTKSCSGN